MKLLVWWSLESWDKLVLPKDSLQRMAVPELDDVGGSVHRSLTPAFLQKLLAFLYAPVFHSFLRFEPLIPLDLVFYIFDFSVNLPHLELFVYVFDHAVSCGIFWS